MLNPRLPTIWYGGDYNPDQWPEEVWREDVRLFKLAGINVATLPVFGWARLQPAEDRYDFDWLDRVLDLLTENGISACLATPTAAQPAWMSKRYPDILPVDVTGTRRMHGRRVNFCPNSPNYRRLSQEMARRLAERYREHPALVAWHVANEYGHYCYCDLCAEAFRAWLKARYGSLDAVNEAWYTSFWGHTFSAWDEIETPTENGERGNQPMLLDYDRFQSDAILECYLGEYRILKAATPDVPVTTNLMGPFKPLDYHAWAPHLDVVSWDNYPPRGAHMGTVAMRHELMRGLKDGQPFMLMEQTPGTQNWQAYNAQKRPGVMRLWSYQAVAHGADTVMFFQLRRSRGGPEKYHSAVIEHVGHEHTRVFREVAALGKELAGLGDTLLDARQRARVALLFDWQNWWALEYSSGPSILLEYLPQLEKYYTALWGQNIATDVVRPDADLSAYDLVVAPALYMVRPGVAANLEGYVRDGGTLVTTFFSGMVNENDLVTLGGYPGELRDLLGIWVEENDALLPDESNTIEMVAPLGRLQGSYTCGMLCDVLHAEGAEVLATYGSDYYAGYPVLTRHRYGQGWACYVASDPDPAFVADLLGTLCDERGIEAPLSVPEGVEVTQRHKGDATYTFVLNHNAEPVRLALPAPARDLLSGRCLEGEVDLVGNDVLILT